MTRFCVIFTAVAVLAVPNVFLFPRERSQRRRLTRLRAVAENDVGPRPELPTHGANKVVFHNHGCPGKNGISGLGMFRVTD